MKTVLILMALSQGTGSSDSKNEQYLIKDYNFFVAKKKPINQCLEKKKEMFDPDGIRDIQIPKKKTSAAYY